MKNHHFHDLKGERKNQLLITTDLKGNKTGLATREECHSGEGQTHLAFMAFVINENSKIILTKRSHNKSLWAGVWDASVVSHVLPQETVEQAAKRRGKEELGVEVDFKDVGAFYYFVKHGDSAENEYCHVLIGTTNDEVHPNPVEISKLKMIDKGKLKKEVLADKNSFTPWLKLALDKFEIYQTPGV